MTALWLRGKGKRWHGQAKLARRNNCYTVPWRLYASFLSGCTCSSSGISLFARNKFWESRCPIEMNMSLDSFHYCMWTCQSKWGLFSGGLTKTWPHKQDKISIFINAPYLLNMLPALANGSSFCMWLMASLLTPLKWGMGQEQLSPLQHKYASKSGSHNTLFLKKLSKPCEAWIVC